MTQGKAVFKQSTIRRAFDAALKAPVPVHSMNLTAPDGTSLSFVFANSTDTNTDPVTTITESELKDLI
jgi:hypothetical protein